MISRRALAHALGDMKTGSLARADRRGKGPGRPIAISKTFVVYRDEDVAVYLRARGLSWAEGTVRPIEDKTADPRPSRREAPRSQDSEAPSMAEALRRKEEEPERQVDDEAVGLVFGEGRS